MYFSSKKNHNHGIMFHHFHDNNIHKKSQGSIDKDQFVKIIKYIGKENILNPNDFIKSIKKNPLSNKVCFTFDDSLKCQFDIALPILEDFKIKSFFFIYSNVFSDKPELLEVFRYFRINFFKDIEDFYKEFFIIVDKMNKKLDGYFLLNEKLLKYKKKEFPFYTINDIKFRIMRDNLLGRNQYNEIMISMFGKKNFKPEDFYHQLFMRKNDISKLYNLDHSIGLHSHTHPTLLEKLSYNEQMIEYKKNLDCLYSIFGKKRKINSVSHPCGSYNLNTLSILNNLEIKIGFKNILNNNNIKYANFSDLEIGRKNHSEILNLL